MTLEMLRRSLGALLLATTLVAPQIATAVPLPPGLSGSWHNPQQRGHGLSITVHSPQDAIVYWYSGDPLGNPLTLYSETRFDGVRRLRGEAQDSRGIRFGQFDPATHRLTRWGDLEIELLGCDRMVLRYDANGPAGGAGYGRGEIEMQKLAGVRNAACESGSRPVGVFGGTLRVPGHAPEYVSALFGAEGAVYVSIDRGLKNPGALLIDDAAALGESALDLHFAGYRQPSSYQPPGFAAYDLPANEVSRLSTRLETTPTGYRGVIEPTSPGLPPASIVLTPIYAGPDFGVTGDVPLSAWPGSYYLYEGFVNAPSRRLTVAADGRFEGYDTDGFSPVCRYRGRLTKRLAPGVEFEVELALESCGERDGEYAGKAWIAAHDFDGKAVTVRIATVRTSSGPPLASQLGAYRNQ